MKYLALSLLVVACGSKPKYPFCEQKDQCRDGEFCVKGKCLECTKNADCSRGEACDRGTCIAATTCESSADCDGEACIDERCQPCQVDGDCGTGFCQAGTCLAGKPCEHDPDCADDEDCIGGICSQPWISQSLPNVNCVLPVIYFEFDEATLTADARSRLDEAAECLSQAEDRSVIIEAHTDAAGTQEYNIALSERRGLAALRYLQRLGVREARMAVVPKGENIPSGNGEDRDRRAILIWK